ncbi:MAG: DUF3830 family protein [Nitrospirae bacterium]|nr:DUF3830 family protein [Nitrospirota bacterium]
MAMLRIRVASFEFTALMEEVRAPQTCKQFRRLLPYAQKLIHARWSGEACWIPLGDFRLDVGTENATSYPAPGDILFYPGGLSETEILFPYGATCFAGKLGRLAGNHFLTITEGREHLQDFGRLVLWHGAQEILFEEA